jgi:hypothetical protein
MYGGWIDGAIAVGVIIGAIVLIVWLFKKEVRGISVPGPLKNGMGYLLGKVKGSGGKIKNMNILTRIYKAMQRAGNGMRGIK